MRFFFVHPLQMAFALVVSSVTFGVLFFLAGVSWPVALPWALFAMAALRLEMKKETTPQDTARHLLRRIR